MKISNARKNAKNTKKVVQKAKPAASKAKAFRQLDSAAQQWAQLIADPCGARLTNSIWPGTAGSFVARFETDYVIFSEATATAGNVVFVPGGNSVFVNKDVLVNDTATSTLLTNVLAPGVGFLNSVAGAVRCVAACAQVSFPGTELSRSGIVAGGVTNFGNFAQNVATTGGGANTAVSAAQVRTLCQHTERMPSTMMEILWMPGAGDQDWYEVGSTQTPKEAVDDMANKNCIVLSASGFPVSTGIRVRLVSVLEWTPRANQGMVSSVEIPKSFNSVNDVLRALPASKGTDWFINAHAKARPWLRAAGSAISYGAKILGPALLSL